MQGVFWYFQNSIMTLMSLKTINITLSQWFLSHFILFYCKFKVYSFLSIIIVIDIYYMLFKKKLLISSTSTTKHLFLEWYLKILNTKRLCVSLICIGRTVFFSSFLTSYSMSILLKKSNQPLQFISLLHLIYVFLLYFFWIIYKITNIFFNFTPIIF